MKNKPFNLRIFKAIEHATILYKGNLRKSTGVDQILHPFGVFAILSHYGYDDDILIGGLMHDVIEDCTQTGYSLKKMEKDYGKTVAKYVDDMSEISKKLPWAERKIEHVERIKTAPLGSKLIECADKINNLYGIMDGINEIGEGMWSHFNSSKEQIAWYYIEMYNACVFGHENKDIEIFKDLKKLIEHMRFFEIAETPKINKELIEQTIKKLSSIKNTITA